MEEFSQTLDEAALLLAAVVVGIAKFQEYLVIWKVEGQESAPRGGRIEGPMLAAVQSLERLTRRTNGAKMLKLAIGWTLFSSKFIGTELLLSIDPVAVSQRL